MKKILYPVLFVLTVLLIYSIPSFGQVQAKAIDNKALEAGQDNYILETQTIVGDSLKISVWDNLRMQIWKWQNGGWVHQVYGTNNKGFKLFFNEDNMASYFNGNEPTPVSNTLTDDHTIVSVVEKDNVRITQTVTYANGQNYYSVRWDIQNNTSSVIDSVKFLAGEDTYFAGSDNGMGYYDASRKMVYVKNTQGGETGIMGFYGIEPTPATSYMEAYYSTVRVAVAAGILPNTVNPLNVDSGYALGWRMNNMEPGQTWTIYAREVFQNVAFDDEAPSVTVNSPNGGETLYAGVNASINWTATDNRSVEQVDIYYSTDNGENYTNIVSGYANTSPYTWAVPEGLSSSQCLVKVTAYDASFNSSTDVSDAVFTISETAPSTTMTAEYGPPTVANEWQKFTIPLTHTSFGVDEATFEYILSSVYQFRIRTEMHSGDDVGSLDDVTVGTLYSSDFASDLEGWSAAGDGTMGWVATGGVSDGYLQVNDWASGDWHWAVAPAGWIGDWRGQIGNNIEFYFKTDHPSSAAYVEISRDEYNRLVLSADPQTLSAGGNSTVRVTAYPAPSTDLTIGLNSSDTGCIDVPDNVVINGGQSYVEFTAGAVGATGGCSSVLTATATDYSTSRLTLNVQEGSASGTATLTGRVTSATTGDGIPNATVRIGDLTTTTNENGDFTLTNVPISGVSANFSGTPQSGTAPLTVQFTDLSSAGYQTVQVSADGYISSETAVVLTGGGTVTQDFSLSPTLTDDEFRLVLNWGESPSDLDIYLKTPEIDGTEYVVSWQNEGTLTAAPWAALDHDDMYSYGPETITINKVSDGTYKCYIHNYSGSPDISTSNAVVQIYGKTGLLNTVTIPTVGTGRYWHVCEIDGATGNISITNTISNDPPAMPGFEMPVLAEKKVQPRARGIAPQTNDIVSWQWDFENDGMYDSELQNPSHVYTTSGYYSVKLRVFDGTDYYTRVKEEYIHVISSGEPGNGLKVNISSIDVTGFPLVKCYTSVLDSATFSPITGLTSANFAVKEDGTTESPITVEEVSSETGGKADIVFVFDVTGSMGGEINSLKAKVLDFANALESRGIDYRLALVTYGDKIRDVFDFTADAEEFKTWVEGLSASGGDDSKENSLEGLARATDLSYRAVSQRLTILITDADYHEAGETGNGTTTYTTETMVELLKSKSIVNNVVGPDYTQYHQLAEDTGGLYFNISSDFETIIDMLGNIISSQYIVSYTTHNTSVNNTWRYVNVNATSSAKTGYDDGRYYIGTATDNVSSFNAYAVDYSHIVCRWYNPADTTFSGVRVLRKQSGYPTGPADGTVVYEGTASGFMDSGLDANTRYYYGAFAYNLAGVYSAATVYSQDWAVTYNDEEIGTGWKTLASGTTNDLMAVTGADSFYVWAVGDNGTSLRSADGGSNWANHPTSNSTDQLKDVSFVSQNTGWLAGASSSGAALIYKSGNTGVNWYSWSSSSSAALWANCYVNDLYGWNVGANGKIEKTVNGGGSYSALTSGVTETLYDVCFINSKTGWASGANGKIIKTSDGGKTWSTQSSGVSSIVYSIHFQNAFYGWAATGDGKVLRTVDGGNTWTSSSLTTTALEGIHFSDPLNGYVVGAGGKIYGTTDSGTTWEKEDVAVTNNLHDVYLISPYWGWAVGDNGTILRLQKSSAADAYKGYHVNISSIDAEAFPKIKCFVTVIDTTGGEYEFATGLTSDHFTLAEDETNESPLTVSQLSSSSGARADIVFVFDVTGSMGDEINGLKERAVNFADVLAAKGIDYRLGLVTFGDEVQGVHDFTDDISEFKTWIEALSASGGADSKENALEGLERATTLSFRGVTQKIAILITDADYHEAGESGDGTTDQTTTSIITLLNSQAIVTNVVGKDITEYHQISSQTGGLFYNINGDFQSIVDQISDRISTQYVVTYTTHNSTADSRWRDVALVVQNGTLAGYDSGQYYVGTSKLAMSPTNLIGIVNSTFTIQINVESIINLGLCNLKVAFEPAKFEVVEATAGDFLKQDGASDPLFLPTINNAAGTVEINTTRIGTTSGASGNGTLATIKFKVLLENCTGDLSFASVNLRTPDNASILVTTQGTHIDAVVSAGLLGDFDSDYDIDTRDFALLATYWKPANSSTGDIGPASGTPPTLTPAPDGVVNFEDLFVFTRMWNWYHETVTPSLAKTLAGQTQLEWRIDNNSSNTNKVCIDLWAENVNDLSMGHLVLKYDAASLSGLTVKQGKLLTNDNSGLAFLVDQNRNAGVVDLAFARLPQKGQNAAVRGSGVIARFELDKHQITGSSFIELETVDLRNVENNTLSINAIQPLSLSSVELPTSFSLDQNYPNPFNSRTTFQFKLPQDSPVVVQIINILGQPVRTIVDGRLEAGIHKAVWDGKNDYGQEVVSGVYLVRMKADNFNQTREILFLK